MKNKTKLVLMATGLSCAVLGCLGSASYAWFVTQNNVGIHHSQLTVQSTSPNLSILMTRIVPSAESTISLTGVQNIDTAINFSDASSQFGERFFKKNANASTYTAISSSNLDGVVLQYGFKVTNLALATPMTLQLNTVISNADDAASQYLKNWVRMGVYRTTDSTYKTRNGTGFAGAFMCDTSADGMNQYINGVNADGLTTFGEGELHDFGDDVAVVAEVQAQSTYFFKFSVWMEGTAATDQDLARGGTIALTTSFSLV